MKSWRLWVAGVGGILASVCSAGQVQRGCACNSAEADPSRYPMTAEDLVGVLGKWQKDRRFFDAADAVFESRSTTEWSAAMERRVAAAVSGVALDGGCRDDLCRYTATVSTAAGYEALRKALGTALIWSNNDEHALAAVVADQLTEPQRCRFFVFRARLPAPYLEPLAQALNEPLKR